MFSCFLNDSKLRGITTVTAVLYVRQILTCCDSYGKGHSFLPLTRVCLTYSWSVFCIECLWDGLGCVVHRNCHKASNQLRFVLH